MVSASAEAHETTRLRLDIAYDGTDFSGWARQPGRRTVCGEIEEKLSAIVRTPVLLTVAGRTDAGVHASGQVAHVDVPSAVLPDDPSRWVRRLARFLPRDVRVTGISVAPEHFDARFSAIRRHYEYRLTTAVYGAEPLRARDTVAWPKAVDLDAMQRASQSLLGLHDAFCWSMVRSLVGAALAVGEGRRSVEWMTALLDERERAASVAVAPAHGLSLVRVDYPADEELAARNAATREMRGPITPGCCG